MKLKWKQNENEIRIETKWEKHNWNKNKMVIKNDRPFPDYGWRIYINGERKMVSIDMQKYVYSISHKLRKV